MNGNGHGTFLEGELPPLSADLLLLHAPAFFDFRERRDIYFPFLGTSGDVPITPLYEYFPIGFKMLDRHLTYVSERSPLPYGLTALNYGSSSVVNVAPPN